MYVYGFIDWHTEVWLKVLRNIRLASLLRVNYL